MAKPRKQKNDEQKTGNAQSGDGAGSSCAVVRHQKLCLSVDMENQRIYGHTELKVVVPESGVIGLYASCMNVDNVAVDGRPVQFEFYAQHQPPEDEKRWLSVTCIDAADIAGSTYFSSLEREMAPDLLIFCSKSISSDSEEQNPADTEKAGQVIAVEGKMGASDNNALQENVKLVRIEYWLEKPEVGVHFMGNTLHTHNQIRRARCWFPCVDSNLQSCSYDLEFTVDSEYVAVSNGTLLYQVFSSNNPPRKTYVYSVNIPVAAEFITLAVAPFEVLPDRHNGIISHFCMPVDLSKLQCTVSFFSSVFSFYEEYLAASFPLGSYKQVFIDSEAALTSTCVGASMSIFSSHLLFDERVIDQTIGTRIKLAHALARQWFGIYITADTANDGWLLEGLAGFLTDSFIKRFLGNNEARYRRYKANEAVCKVDVRGATALSSSAAAADLYGTQSIGVVGKLRSWKAVAILQMLEKQMGPESFRKILQRIIYRAQDVTRVSRTLSTKEFRHFANKIGNLERPFLKEFFPRWVESCGCPVLRMGVAYNKRRNMIELAVARGCTSSVASAGTRGTSDCEFQAGDVGWPGMMSIRVYELDGMYDHPSLPMAGDTCQLLEIQCHSKLAARRIQRPKKGSKADGSDDNGDVTAAIDTRPGMESPLLWLRADPEMEYLAEINMHQPVQMWINQLEKDKDVVAQLQAIATLCSFPQVSFANVNALNNCLNDSKVFWRVRIEAACALAKTAAEETDWAGLLHLIKFYKSRRFDPDIGLPRPNDFHDFSEYFVLEAIPHAVAMVRGSDGKSPPEAVDFILQLLKYNDNSGNPYSDVYWLAALVESIGKIEFGQQSIQALSPLLKRIDCLLQFDRLMPSYNGVLTVSCIRTLTQIALKLSDFVPFEHLEELIKPFQDVQTTLWQIRVEAMRALIDLKAHSKGLDIALSLAVKMIKEEPSLRVQVKVLMRCLHLCQMKGNLENTLNNSALAALLCLLQSRKAFNNVTLRHHIFCVLQTLAGRSATLFGVEKPKVLPVSGKPMKLMDTEVLKEQKVKSGSQKLRFLYPQEPNAEQVRVTSDVLNTSEALKEMDVSGSSGGNERKVRTLKFRLKPLEAAEDVNFMDTSRGGGLDERIFSVGPIMSSSMSVEAGRGVDAALEASPCTPGGEAVEAASVQEFEQKPKEVVYDSHANGSQANMSISSAKDIRDYEIANDLQCTADSMNAVSVVAHTPLSTKDTQVLGSRSRGETPVHNEYFPVAHIEDTGFCRSEQNSAQQELRTDQLVGESTLLMTEDSVIKNNRQEKKRKDRKGKEERKERKRKREKEKHDHKHEGDHYCKQLDKHSDPEYLERKRLKKEQKRREKEQLRMQKIMDKEFSADLQKPESSSIQRRPETTEGNSVQRMSETVETSSVQSRPETTEASSVNRKPETMETTSVQKIRIKIKTRGSLNR
eukprot:Gb_36379 [translate_table: standard]